MYGKTAAIASLRCAGNRVVPRGRLYFRAVRNSFHTLTRQGILNHEPQLVNNTCVLRGTNSVGMRAYGTAKQGNDGNMVLIVGLGALGLATFAFVKSDMISFNRRVPSKNANSQTEVNSKETNSNLEQNAKEGDGSESNDARLNELELDAQEIRTVESPENLETGVSDCDSRGDGVLTNPVDATSYASQELGGNEPQDNKPVDFPGKDKEESLNVDEKSTSEEVANVVAENKENITVKTKDLPRIPTHAPYVIIGGGTASHAACRSIRKHDPTAKILVIGEEEVLPYMRPPLSKELWFGDDEEAADTLYFKQWNGKRRSVFFEDDTYYVKPQALPLQENGGVAVLTGHKVINIDPVTHRLYLKHGHEIQYDKLLLATGGSPKNIDLFEKSSEEMKSKVTLFRTVADYRKLDRLIHSLDSVAIVGGGFLGSELACALGSKGKRSGMQVSQIYHESGNMGKVLPKYLSEWTTKKVQNEGVNIYPNAQLVSADLTGDGKVSISLDNGQKVNASHVIVCAGIDPSTELASSAGLEVDPELGGFRVNSELQARSDIWVAGDAACFYDVKLGRRRVEHHDHAIVSGRLAGENMTGGKKSYLHQSMFWSDLGPEVGYEAIGIVDNTLDTVGVWAKATKADSPKAVVEATDESLRSQTEEDAGENESPALAAKDIPDQGELSEDFGKGVVFYLQNDVVVGILLWNVFNKMPVARKIIRDGKKQEGLVELAKLFNIHE